MPLGPLIEDKFEIINASEQEVYELLISLDPQKATGPDGISPKLLKLAGWSVVPSLTKLINLSLSLGIVPQLWKQANVIPLHKKGDRSDINNYRPVSILSCPSKILEKIVFKNLFNYLNENHLITPHQSGFMPGDSTVNQLAYLYHTFCQALDNKKNVRIVFCDISKAFDRCWHDGILYKLKSLGIGQKSLSWFQNYLSNRLQKVVIKGQESKLGSIQAGVPQGSVLGPLLFLVYINDLPDCVKSNMKLFADDATIYFDFVQSNIAANVLNVDLKNIQAWADQWLVNFSAPKTKSMTVTFKKEVLQPDLIFNSNVLNTVSEHKHLGLTLSKNLGWTPHIQSIIKNVSPMIDVLKKLKYSIDRKSLETIYFTFIRPKLEYGCHVWDNCDKKDSDLLEKSQLDVGRIVACARKGTSNTYLYEELNWQTLKSRRELIKLKLFSKIVDKSAPTYLCELIPENTHTRNLRNQNNIRNYKCRTETYKTSFIPASVQSWNQLQISERNINFFTESLRSYKSSDLYNYGPRETALKLAQMRMKCSKLNAHLLPITLPTLYY